ncbi:MAG: IS481 family transposase, partial [Sedimenticola sp.]
MNLHKNAKTCPNSRALMVRRVLVEKHPVSEVAEMFGVSTRTVYKWLRRYREGAEVALTDRSSRPRQVSHRLGSDWIALIVELRRHYHFTAQRIADQLGLARSTVSAVLKRNHLSSLKQLAPKPPVVRYEHAAPGDMIHMDIKRLGRFNRPGHRVKGKPSSRSVGAGWEYVHVCIDDHSRVAYVEVLPDERRESAMAFLGRAVDEFARLGIRIRQLLTDNGSCYRSKRFRKHCQALGIKHRHTRPYRPQTNGKAERFIQTMLREWAYGRVYASSEDRLNSLPTWITHYNQHRKHGSLDYKPPLSRITGVNNLVGIH